MIRLTPAEYAVMGMICDGKTNRAIATERGTSPRTVKHQVHDILNKLGADNRTHAVAIWMKRQQAKG